MGCQPLSFRGVAVSAPAGFPDHPHRGLTLSSFDLNLLLISTLFFPVISSPGGDSSAGFETVTYMLEVVILSID